jgi:TonB-linked SusC/RagA family outer membrane protein
MHKDMKLNFLLKIFTIKPCRFKEHLRIMRISLFLIFVCAFQLAATNHTDAQNVKVEITENNLSVKQLLTEIEKQTDFLVLLRNNDVDVNRMVHLKKKSGGLTAILDDAFQDMDVSYEFQNKYIVLSKNESVDALINQQADKRITGTVIDSKGEPIIGANISEKGTKNGTASDVDGRFSLQINPGAVLVITYIGYTSQEIVVGDQTNLNITLSEDNLSLEEVVVVGYGVQKKATLTGAVTSVSGTVTANKPSTSLLNALQGTLSGVNFSRVQGTPGNEEWDLQIRGASSLNGSTPLVIVDDVPYYDYKRLNNMNANDIESISVLKDASAAIYGARAAGGVILITTKKGDEPKPTIHYNGQFTYKYPGIHPQPTNRQQYALIIDEGNKNDNKPAGEGTVGFLRDWDYWMNGYDGAVNPGPLSDSKDFTYADNDWFDLIFGDAIDNAHNLSVSGKSNKFRYFSSVGYHTDNGILNYGDTRYRRLNVRASGIYDVADNFKVEVSLALEKGNRHLPTLLDAAMAYRDTMPNLAMQNSLGQNYAFGGTRNPVARLRDGGVGELKELVYNAKIKFDYSPIKDLTITALASNNGGNGITENITKQIQWYGWTGDLWTTDPGYSSSNVYKQSVRDFHDNYSAYINYKKAFGEHAFSLLGGGDYESYELSSFWARRNKLISEEIPSLNMGESTEQYNGDSYSAWKIASLYGRFNYAFSNKYLFEANFRYDGSSRFAPTKRFETFGGASAGWVLSQEGFLQDSFINFLKARASYGSVGNQNGIGLYDYLQLININSGTTVFGEVGERAGYTDLGGIASTERTWERVSTANLGLDIAVLDNHLSANFDYYWKRNSNMLIASTLPSILGVTPPTMNIGKLKTWGWDLTLQWKDQAGPVRYFAGLNLSDNQNLLTDLNGLDNVFAGFVNAREGYPINALFGYVSEGIMKTQEEVDAYKQMPGVQQNLRIGDIKYKDVSGDGKLNPVPDKTTGDPGDLVYLGNRNPRYVFAVNGGLDYKGFDFSFLLQGQMKQDRNIVGILSYPGASWFYNQDTDFLGLSYNPITNPNATYPAISSTGAIVGWNYHRSSTFTYYNNRYGRLKNITLGYTLPSQLMSKIKIQQLRLYISGNDVWEFKAYRWSIDPETSLQQRYPLNRYWMVGLDLTF